MSDHTTLIVLGYLIDVSLLCLLVSSLSTRKRIKKLETTVANLEALAVQTNKENEK